MAKAWTRRANNDAFDAFGTAARAEGEIDTAKQHEQSAPVPYGERFRTSTMRLVCRQQGLGKHEACVDVAWRHQAEVSDLGEPFRQDVFEEATDEGLRCHGDRAAVSCGDRDVLAVVVGEPVVGDRDSVGISAEIGKNLLGASERSFAVDDPVFVEELGEQSVERGNALELRREIQLSPLVGMFDGIEDFPAEELGEHFDGEQVLFPGCNPAFTVESETTPSDNAVQMRVKTPSVTIP